MITPRSEGFFPRTFDSLRESQFRWFYAALLGQMSSMHMQMVVRGYLVFVLTGSYAALGLVALASAVPMLLLSVFGGVAADRLPRRMLLQSGQVVSLVNVATLAALVFADLMRLEWLLVSSVVQGTVLALTMPARQAMIPDIVGMGRMMNAISLYMAGMNSTRLFAPAIGGFIVGFAGFGWAFLTMAAFYAMAFVALTRVNWHPAVAPGRQGAGIAETARDSLRDIREGARYVVGDRVMRLLLGVSFASALFALPYMSMLPGYVADVFGGGGSELGVLVSVGGVGALAGAMVLASMPARRRGLMLLGGSAVVAIGLFSFAQTPSYWVAAGFMVVVGLGSAFRMALSQGLIHTYVDGAYRGRVMSLYITQLSIMQLATFFLGVIAEVIGIRVAFAGLGVGLMLVAIGAFLFVPLIRRLD